MRSVAAWSSLPVMACFLLTACGSPPEQPEAAVAESAPAEQQIRVVQVSSEKALEIGLALAVAAPGKLQSYLGVTGEINFDPERIAHVVPTVPGIVRESRVGVGSKIRAGDLLAVLESRELAEARSAHLTAYSRLGLAERTFERESKLRESRVSTEQDYLAAQQALEEARIELRASKHQLEALGIGARELERLVASDAQGLSHYELRSPLDGIVIEKHATKGESLDIGSEAFMVADPSSVWALFTVFAKDVPFVTVGKHVELEGAEAIQAVIDYVAPVMDEQTRSTKARVVLGNSDMRWRPGMFVTGRVLTDDVSVELLVPAGSVQSLGDESVVFVPVAGGFEARPVRVGRRSTTVVEIVEGLQQGESVVSSGAFTLKSELEKAQFEEE